ncbi:MBL fold metallo-hydrolase [Rufibacter ruber]|uniref:MBL fold metallo-hydrolase n=1 Tax=Rufibacter ruber TaxID=1783499 RepID=UPI0008363579|nr:rhodanese-like domain-containing protein [Rufibacter ruber]
MKIEQFEDKGLAHYSYIIMSDAEIAVIDPARNPKPYEEYAMLHDARIVAIIETHPHADFVSGHLELSEAKQTPIYVSGLAGAEYKHTPFDEPAELKVGQVTLQAMNTPGHSPDSISVLLRNEEGKAQAVFTGDTLFIGDVGRPDLRETVGTATATRQELARQMYHSTREKLMALPDHVTVYPAHGAGSLCGKNLSSAPSSTIGEEKRTNPALQPMSEEEFVAFLTADQPFVPAYFAYNVELNRKGAPKFDTAVKQVPLLQPDHKLKDEVLIVDTRPQEQFKQGHLPGAINLQDGPKFETWLGSVMWPDEQFYLIAEDEEKLKEIIRKSASIGYEPNILGAFCTPPQVQTIAEPALDMAAFRANPDQFTIIDIRNRSEARGKQVFAHALQLPLPELREHLSEIPRDKPIVVHCASGYRSAAAASIIAHVVEEMPVYDLGEAVKEFS